MTTPSQLVAPTRRHERIPVLDVVRGFALFGILLINIFSFANPGLPPFFTAGRPLSDQVILIFLLIFVESKFFTVFSFLFGIGFAIQFLKQKNSETDKFVPFFRRRLFFLGLFGVSHIVLLWEGDILLLYALVGLLIIPFRNASPRRLLQWVAALLGVPTCFYLLLLLGLAIGRGTPAIAPSIIEVEAEIVQVFAATQTDTLTLYQNSSYGELLFARLGAFVGTGALLTTRIPTVLAMFLLGLYVGKSNLLFTLADNQRLLKRLRFWGLSLGLGIATLIGLASLFTPLTILFVTAFFNQAIAGPLTAVGYVSALVLRVQKQPQNKLFKGLAAYGRLALTNYIMQSVICTTLFYGYAVGLVGRVSLATAFLLALVINAALMMTSVLWLRFFRMGPLEWLWRSLNYKSIQPIRLQ